jgi:hypothetical protein
MDSASLKVPGVRRGITGHDVEKKAKIIRDDIAPSVSTRPNAASTTIWCTDSVPVKQQTNEAEEDMGVRRINSGTPAGGTRLMVMDLFPGCQGAMHRTDTLDYVIALEGEIEMLLDDSSVTLRAGDILGRVLINTMSVIGGRADNPFCSALVAFLTQRRQRSTGLCNVDPIRSSRT